MQPPGAMPVNQAQTPGGYAQYGMASGINPNQIAANPYTITPQMRRDPSPTAESVLAMGGSVSKGQIGTDPATGAPIYGSSYQMAAPGYQAKLALDKLMSTNVATPGANVPRETYQPQTIRPIDTRDAQNAAFARQKSTAGALAQSGLESLRSQLADRGILGGGTEARGIVDRLAAAANPLSDLNVAQLHENVGLAQHAQDLGEQRGQTIYQGNIQQRAQDVQEQIARQQQRNQLIMEALKAVSY